MSSNAAPPAWRPHQITHRLDGWVIDPKHENRIPAAVAEMIARAIPQHGGNTVAAIRRRMYARHRRGNV